MEVLITIFQSPERRKQLKQIICAAISQASVTELDRGWSMTNRSLHQKVQQGSGFDLIIYHCGGTNPEYNRFVSDYRSLRQAQNWVDPTIILFSGDPDAVTSAESTYGNDPLVCAVSQEALEANLKDFLVVWIQTIFAGQTTNPPCHILRGYGEEAGLMREYALEILIKCKTPEGFEEAKEVFKQLKALFSGQPKEDEVARVYKNEFLNLLKKFPEPKQTDIFSPEYREALTKLKNALFDALRETTSEKKSSASESERILRTFKHDCSNLFGAVLSQLISLKQSSEENKKEEVELLTKIVRQNWKGANSIESKEKEFTALCERLSQMGFNVEAECAEEVKNVHAAFDVIRRNMAYFHLDADELQLSPSDMEKITAHAEEMRQALNTILTGLAQMVSKLTAVKDNVK